MRVENSIKNMKFGFITQILSISITFITRTVLISTIGVEYLGISGLFSNILSILSLAELGVGQAINYSLYSAISENNERKIKGIMYIYKKIYTLCGVTIGILGIGLAPFINNFVDSHINWMNIIIIYILYLLNSVISYLYIYNSSYVIAKQKNYLISLISNIIFLLTSVIQIVILNIFKDYIIYYFVSVVSTGINNLCVNYASKKMYPILEKKEDLLSKEEKKYIFINIKSMMIYKIGTVVLNSTDNIIMSKFVNLTFVGIYSNYNLIIISVNQILNSVFSGITASIGSLAATDDMEKKKLLFNILDFSLFWIYGLFSVGMSILFNQFIELWVGKEYILSQEMVNLLVLNFYIGGLLFAPYIYRQTLGLFIYGKARPLISAIINLILSMLLVFSLGGTGVVLATIITRILTNCWYDPYIVMKKGLNCTVKNYYIQYIQRCGIICIYTMFLKYLLAFEFEFILAEILLKGIIIIIIYNLLNLIFFRKSKEFIYIKNIVLQNILKRNKEML